MKEKTKWNLITAGLIAGILAALELFRAVCWILYDIFY